MTDSIESLTSTIVAEKPNTIRETDDAARMQARLLMRGARFGSIAVFDPETGYPNCSRVLVGTANDGVPVILASRLSAHTRALLADQRASLLVGEPGKGDPLAHPRLSVQCKATPIERESVSDARIRRRFIRRHKKANLYAGFPDFLFFRLEPTIASLNGGFGKAYMLEASDLVIDSPLVETMAENEETLLETLKQVWATRSRSLPDLKAYENWTPCAVDPEGIDLTKKDQLKRIGFVGILTEWSDVEQMLETVLTRLTPHT